jgi:4-hydroxy-tetrahydrodipicolinate reductase
MSIEGFKYGLIGSTGKLASEVKTVFSEKGGELVFTYSKSGFLVNDIPEIIIDCSLPTVLDISISFAKKYDVPLIVATTGLSSIQIENLKLLSESVPVVQSYDFSIGIQVLLKLVDYAKNYLANWDVEIEEAHHRFKKDKPSGTAKMIQDIFKNKDTNISSLRLGNIIGEHSVHFGSLGEVVTIKHSATSRRTFAEGIMKSVLFVQKRKDGFFSFADVIYSENEFSI